MPSEHARLSPSGSERWLQCPASIRMEEQVPPEPDSVYAREGTAAHTLAEIEARHALLFANHPDPELLSTERALWAEEYADEIDDPDELEIHIDAYLDLLRERLAVYPDSVLMLEQRMDTGVPTCWGTSDAVIVSPEHVEIVDLKYGKGVQVEADGNPQLRLYALGALDTFGYMLGDTQAVFMTVFQPRIGNTLTAHMTPDDLRAWRESILPIAASALEDGAPFGPSESACRWCAASGRCKAQLEDVFRDGFEDPPETLTPEEVAETCARLPRVRNWLEAFEKAALRMAYSEGTPIPGWKVVLSGGKRYVSDEQGALKHLVDDEHWDIDEVSRRKILGIGDLERLLGKKGFAEIMSPYVRKTDGKASLVPESDRRSAISPETEARKAFQPLPKEQT